MNRVVIAHDFESFRSAARPLLAAGVEPAHLIWQDPTDAQESLFATRAAADSSKPHAADSSTTSVAAAPRAPRRFVELAELASLYRSPDRLALLYRVLYRLTHGEHQLLEDDLDPDVRALQLRVQSVRKDAHRMHAFVRFRKLELEGQERFIAWYAPEHHMQTKVQEANMKEQLKGQVDSAAPLVPNTGDVDKLRRAAKKCLACPAGELENQTVFGEGDPHAKLCLVGEQPGDEEDKRGRPFVGPAGRVLDKALAEAKVPREELYVTNAVKHFVYIYRGKRRIHSKPSLRIVRACKPWLEAEIKAVKPEVVLCLGATAAQSFMGPRFSITRNRGRTFETPWAKAFVVTYHPSAILRMEDGPAEQAYKELVSDLELAYSLVNPGADGGKRRRSSA